MYTLIVYVLLYKLNANVFFFKLNKIFQVTVHRVAEESLTTMNVIPQSQYNDIIIHNVPNISNSVEATKRALWDTIESSIDEYGEDFGRIVVCKVVSVARECAHARMRTPSCASKTQLFTPT